MSVWNILIQNYDSNTTKMLISRFYYYAVQSTLQTNKKYATYSQTFEDSTLASTYSSKCQHPGVACLMGPEFDSPFHLKLTHDSI